MHNFENQLELEATGKKFPLRGKLRSIATTSCGGKSMFGYVSDDHTWVHVELREQQLMRKKESVMPMMVKAKSYSSVERTEKDMLEESVADNDVLPLRKLKEDYLNANGFFEDGAEIEDFFKPAHFFNLKKRFGIQAIVDVELVELPLQQNVYLFVIHQSDFDKAVATSSR